MNNNIKTPLFCDNSFDNENMFHLLINISFENHCTKCPLAGEVSLLLEDNGL
jgi:hypothetical protein